MTWKDKVATFVAQRFSQFGVNGVACSVMEDQGKQFIAISSDLPGDPLYDVIQEVVRQIPEVSMKKSQPVLELANSSFVNEVACLSLPIMVIRQTIFHLRKEFKLRVNEYKQSKEFVEYYGYLPDAEAYQVAAWMMVIAQDQDFEQIIKQLNSSGASNDAINNVKRRLDFVRKAQRMDVVPNPVLENKIRAFFEK